MERESIYQKGNDYCQKPISDYFKTQTYSDGIYTEATDINYLNGGKQKEKPDGKVIIDENSILEFIDRKKYI